MLGSAKYLWWTYFIYRCKYTAILPGKDNFYLFDFHSSDDGGLYVLNHTTVFLRFNDLLDLERYIQVAYLEFIDIQRLYFQLPFITIDITPRIKNEGTLSYNRIRKNYQKRLKLIQTI